MTKRIIAILLCVVCIFTLFTACKPKEEGNVVPLPEAESNPDITKPEGSFFETADGSFYANGKLSVLGVDFIKLMIEGKEWEFAISKEAQHQIDVYNKDPEKPMIMEGTMLQIKYEKRDLIFIAKEIEILIAN